MTDLAMYSLDEEGVVVFGFQNLERVISGPEEALQLVAYHLFTTLGTNSFDRDEGGSIQSLARGNLKSEPEIQTEAMIAISRTISKIREIQDTDKKADSTITGLRLLGVSVDYALAKIKLRLRVDLLDGNSFQATFRVT